ncbi:MULTISPECIES: GOLPH3/VPS74 family protein [unclassified Streptomyces]|uniref:GOLPH3/VPS74 family protein n=1 Tax=Streptomyces sp. NPDC127532 TaxID=3345399 RepID=UPI00363ECA10
MTQDPPGPTLPEELLLLALDPRRGKPLCRGRFLEYGMAGAVLAELELQGRVTEQHGRVLVANPLDPADPLLAVFLRSLPAAGKSTFGSGVSAKRWIRQTARQTGGLYLDSLVERGILRRETHRFLGLLPFHRHPAGPGDDAAGVRDRFTAAERAGFPDRRDRLLAALVSATGLAPEVTADGRRGRAAMRTLRREEWAAHAVHRNVSQDRTNRSGGGDGGGSGGDSGGD